MLPIHILSLTTGATCLGLFFTGLINAFSDNPSSYAAINEIPNPNNGGHYPRDMLGNMVARQQQPRRPNEYEGEMGGGQLYFDGDANDDEAAVSFPYVFGTRDLPETKDFENSMVNSIEIPLENGGGYATDDGQPDNYNAVMRDEEHLLQSGLWGHQYVQGGAGEGKQNLSPAGIFKNVQEIKTDAFLPTYCDPPNPCPQGYSSDDNCLEGVKNTADFSREYQSQQDCLCDPEHMFDCPEDRTFFMQPRIANNNNWNSGGNSGVKNVQEDFIKEMEEKRKHHPVVAKKGLQMGRISKPQPENSAPKEPVLKRVAKKGINKF